MNDIREQFLWKYIDIDQTLIEDLKSLYLRNLPANDDFFQTIDLSIDKFLDIEVQRFVLIQVAPLAIGRIHTDWRPSNYGDSLALNIPLYNCEESITTLWKSEYDPPVQYTSNGQPYRFFEPSKCKKISEFTLTKPILFRTDVPHSVNNKSDKVRRAISIRFKEDPWHLI
jgi:hypothetical protein